MCGRFFVPEDHLPPEIAAIYRELQKDEEYVRGEIKPGQMAVVLAINRKRTESRPFAMTWGFRIGQKTMINARSESVMEKEMFRDLMLQRRCLIPMTSYFEWDHRTRPPIKMQIQPERHICSLLAGIYRMENDLPRFTVLTRDATEDIRMLHDRMPVIFAMDDREKWLSPNLKDPIEFLNAHSLTKMHFESVERQLSFLI